MSEVATYRALTSFRYRLRCYLAFSEQAASDAGLQPRQYQLLLELKGIAAGQRPTIRYLSERLLLRHHSIVGLVDRLVRVGLVARRRSTADGREVLIEMTAKGERLFSSLVRTHRTELRTAGPELRRILSSLSPSAKA